MREHNTPFVGLQPARQKCHTTIAMAADAVGLQRIVRVREVVMTSVHHNSGELEDIDLELIRLAALCGVSLAQPGVLEAIVQRDASVCRNTNRIAWTKLRGLLILRFHVIARIAGVDGPAMAS